MLDTILMILVAFIVIVGALAVLLGIAAGLREGLLKIMRAMEVSSRSTKERAVDLAVV